MRHGLRPSRTHPAERRSHAGDVLALTKPLGSGVLTTGVKAELVEESDYQALCRHMAALNDRSGRAVAAVGEVHACTDITGFGLLGHCYEMASGSGVTIRLSAAALPLMGGARELAEMGIIPAGAYRNMDYVQSHLLVQEGVPQALVDLAADPQTSGGLLAALPPAAARRLLEELGDHAPWSAIVGEVLPARRRAGDRVKEILGKPKGAADLRRPSAFWREYVEIGPTRAALHRPHWF